MKICEIKFVARGKLGSKVARGQEKANVRQSRDASVARTLPMPRPLSKALCPDVCVARVGVGMAVAVAVGLLGHEWVVPRSASEGVQVSTIL